MVTKKKNKYRPVNTNPKKEKKQSSLSAYKFSVNNKVVDFPTLKREVESYFKLFIVRTEVNTKVYEYYHELCRGAFKKVVDTLKKFNGGYDNKEEARIVMVSFTMTPSESAKKKEQVAKLVLADLGRTWIFDDLERTITLETTPSVFGAIVDAGKIVNNDAAKLESGIKGYEYDLKKQSVTKSWKKEPLPTGWLSIEEEHNLLDNKPETIVAYEEEEPIAEGARITDLSVRITLKKEEDPYRSDYILPVKDEQVVHFIRRFEQTSFTSRTVAFMVNTNAADLLKSFKEEPLDVDKEDPNSYWAKYFTKDVELSIFCTGLLDVKTGKISLKASIVYSKVSEEFSNNVEIKITGYKTDVSVFTSKDESTEEPTETMKEIMEAASIDPLDVLNKIQ